MQTSDFLLFWFLAALTMWLAIWPAVLNFKRETRNRYRYEYLMFALATILVTTATNWKDKKNANKAEKKVDSLQTVNEKLAGRNIDSTKKVIDSVNNALSNTKSLIIYNDSILSAQKTAGKYLTSQIIKTSQLQKSLNTASGKLIKEISSSQNYISDIITGGKAYCIPIIEYIGKGKFKLGLKNNFSYQLSIPRIEILDFVNATGCAQMHSQIDGSDVWDKDCFEQFIIRSNDIRVPAEDTITFEKTIPMLFIGNQYNALIITLSYPSHKYYIQLVYQITKKPSRKLSYKILESRADGVQLVTQSAFQFTDINAKMWDSHFPNTNYHLENFPISPY